MSTGRWADTATLLGNGKVLVVGGYNGLYLGTAELYDPLTGNWTSAGGVSARAGPTATLLPDGQVLVAGGANLINGSLADTHLYDPATNTWSAAAYMMTARTGHTATLLPNGKVLLAGGYSGAYLASAELYDPSSDRWTPAGTMSATRYLATATLLPNGKVLVVGGGGASADLYDPETNTWAAASDMSIPRGWATATLLPNGKVLVAGGYFGGYQASAELYDPGSNTWAPTGTMAGGRGSHTATLLPNGKVLVAGGTDNDSTLQTAVLYDPATNTWAPTDDMTAARAGHTATLLTNGTVLITGGTNSSGTLASAEVYTPSSAITDPTSTSLECLPKTAGGVPTNCTATVSDVTSSGHVPTGTATFTVGPVGNGSSDAFSNGGRCNLAAISSTSAACAVNFTPGPPPGPATWSTPIVATYNGDAAHSFSDATTQILVVFLAPAVSTGTALSVTREGAVLTGTVNPETSATTYHFAYGTATTYGTQTADQSAGIGVTDQTVSQAITGLAPNTTYHFRLVATNALGTSYGSDAMFTTQAVSPPPTNTSPPPTTSSTPPSNVSPPVITGTPRVGQTLSVSNGTWSGTAPVSHTYQWQRCRPNCTNITGATGTSYRPTTADLHTKVRVVVTATNTAGKAQAATSQVGPIAASATQIKAQLLAQLAPSGKGAKIAALLKAGGYKLSFKMIEPGRVAIDWYYLPKGATLSKAKAKAKPILIATGKASYSSVGAGKLEVKLTPTGKRALRAAKTLNLTAKGTWTTVGIVDVVATKSFKLKR